MTTDMSGCYPFEDIQKAREQTYEDENEIGGEYTSTEELMKPATGEEVDG